MALICCIFVFIYGIVEKDIWWALLASTVTFFFFFAIELLYACWAFTALMNAITALASCF